ncbi:histone-lysine N-methyltransferase SETMAR-like [Cryptotermes secundus]|uniref:histone-lysine N-methyltransferase SETMAR-like n=1 Tax=Cryptotermes secundus TaxID=105785 RepID=UPI000CD7CFFA|nr:histone-lysine N-methyltransferase SETMAR-like [Cryptotermes secundus]
MATTFWDEERSGDGGIHTIMSEVYCVGPAIQNKKLGMLTYGSVLFHDNVRSRKAARTRALLEHFNWELFNHHPYSPDLAPSDYHPFTYLKNWLGSQCFNNNSELMERVKTWLSSQAADFFGTGMQNLIPRYQCLNCGGD